MLCRLQLFEHVEPPRNAVPYWGVLFGGPDYTLELLYVYVNIRILKVIHQFPALIDLNDLFQDAVLDFRTIPSLMIASRDPLLLNDSIVLQSLSVRWDDVDVNYEIDECRSIEDHLLDGTFAEDVFHAVLEELDIDDGARLEGALVGGHHHAHGDREGPCAHEVEVGSR